jgi:asparagine synthase (glutamine-hydrolysing)
MCGIAGYYSRVPGGEESEALLSRMCSCLTHRGPDGEGTFRDGPVGLAHRRLAIIDLATGQQPVVSEDGRLAVILNGEIYNFRELRDGLVRKGHSFHTKGDAEVILALYREQGRDCVHSLRGMFAFALWDRAARSLWLVRDRIGIKPLYYLEDGSRFLFASEIKAILAHPGVSRALDAEGIDDYLTHAFIPAPRTAFRAVRKLAAGHMLTVTEDGIREVAYWDVDLGPRTVPPIEQAAEQLLSVLRESVATHLVSDVPVGALLSGGLDSSAVVGLMAGALREPVHAISVGFPGAAADELPYARIAARAFRARHDEVEVAEPEPPLLEALARHYDEPFADASALPTFLLCEAARRRATVVLSGDGGDENFGGYRRYRDVARQGGWVGRVREGLGADRLARWTGRAPAGRWIPKPLRRESLIGLFVRTAEDRYREGMTLFRPGLRERLFTGEWRRLLAGRPPGAALEPYLARAAGWDPVSRLQYLDFKTYLADGILTKVDRASMAHGLEVRVPLLDHRVVELAAALPSGYKVTPSGGKRVFKRAVSGFLPREIVTRRKAGFTPPLTRWFRGGLGEMLERSVLARGSFASNLFDLTALRALWDDHRNGGANVASQLWALLVLETWAREYL